MALKTRTLAATFALAAALALPALAATPVNINTADARTIARSLDGIGKAKAQAIVDWRKAHGPFKSSAELAQIKGIGKALVERNREAIRLTGSSPARPAPAVTGKAAR